MGEAICGSTSDLGVDPLNIQTRAKYPVSTQALFNYAPDYEHAIRAGKDARHLWFALREWRGDDPEGYFGNLGAWAETRMKELCIGPD